MSNILKPAKLVQASLFLLLAAAITHLYSCNPGAGGAGPDQTINPDTVRNHTISISEADQMTANFRAAIDTLDKKVPHFKDSMDFGHAEAFPKDVFRELLRRTDSSGPVYGIRIYYGRDASGKIRQILVPYDSNGNDIVRHYVDYGNQPQQGARAQALKVGDGQALENGTRCPPDCGNDSSGLN
ncbi:MAG TPA: hypothetical protein VL978_08150 [Puia sp.]|nr:hypothetical protein [Puia sp.]